MECGDFVAVSQSLIGSCSEHLSWRPGPWQGREGRTGPSGRRIDLDTMYNKLRWVEIFDKTHRERFNKQMNIKLGTPMGWPLL